MAENGRHGPWLRGILGCDNGGVSGERRRIGCAFFAHRSAAGTDGNFILTGRGRLIEVQMSAEGSTFSRAEMNELLDMSEAGCAALVLAQMAALGTV